MNLEAHGFISGLLFGAGVGGHALRLVMLVQDGLPFQQQRGRYFVAISAIVFYSIAFILVALGWKSGLVLSIVGPLIGVSAVLLLKQKIDLFQIVLGVFQLVAVIGAIALL
jgi:hypothetical protein